MRRQRAGARGRAEGNEGGNEGRKGASSLELEGRTPEGGGLSDLRRRHHLWTREGCSGVCGGAAGIWESEGGGPLESPGLDRKSRSTSGGAAGGVGMWSRGQRPGPKD